MKKIAVILALAAVAAAAQAQNLNPTVEVTNIYEGSVTRADKPDAPVTVPDSVTVFNLDFDYSTFERPYMGAYDFSPYLIALKPSPSATNPGQLYVSAGAGYHLRPEADIVWTPCRKGDFHPGVYASLRSFFGPYHNIKNTTGALTRTAISTALTPLSVRAPTAHGSFPGPCSPMMSTTTAYSRGTPSSQSAASIWRTGQ